MQERPALADDTIVGALQASFGIRVATLVFLPIGNDSASWAYRVHAAQGPAYFLKVRAGAGPMPGAAVPSHLHRHGVPHVLAPLATGTGAPSVLVDRFARAGAGRRGCDDRSSWLTPSTGSHPPWGYGPVLVTDTSQQIPANPPPGPGPRHSAELAGWSVRIGLGRM
jgi:hypothetical protein